MSPGEYADILNRQGVCNDALRLVNQGLMTGAGGLAGKIVQLQGGTPLDYTPIPDYDNAGVPVTGPTLWVPSPNYFRDRTYKKIAVALHTESGHEAGTDAEFQNPATQLSANASVDLGGTKRLFVPWKYGAYANGIVDANSGWWALVGVIAGLNPNYQTTSIETEDAGQPDTQEVTAEQYAAVLDMIVNEILPDPSSEIRYLVGHHFIYSGHSCPAQRWLSGPIQQLAQDTGLELHDA